MLDIYDHSVCTYMNVQPYATAYIYSYIHFGCVVAMAVENIKS